MSNNYRIGQIVPSSNTTMETEIPAMLTARQLIRPERFTFHSSRMRMKHVNKEELAAMDAESDRCALELSAPGSTCSVTPAWWPSCRWAWATIANRRPGWRR